MLLVFSAPGDVSSWSGYRMVVLPTVEQVLGENREAASEPKTLRAGHGQHRGDDTGLLKPCRHHRQGEDEKKTMTSGGDEEDANSSKPLSLPYML